jgi:hypothetical protein
MDEMGQSLRLTIIISYNNLKGGRHYEEFRGF